MKIALLVLLLLVGCASPVERARKLADSGDTAGAEKILRAQPRDPEARFLLGKLLLRRNAIAEADQLFADATPEEKARIADVYCGAMLVQQDEKVIAAMAVRAVRWSPRACKDLVMIADERRDAGQPHGELLAVAGSLQPCATSIVGMLPKWIRDLSAKDAHALIGNTPHFTEQQAGQVGAMLRDEAARVAGTQDIRALALLDIVSRVAPSVAGDLDAVVLRSRLSSATGRTPAPSGAAWLLQLYRDGTPREITLRLMNLVGDALEAYRVDQNRYPLAHDFFALRGSLTPRYLSDLPTTDGWGQPFVYIVERDGLSASVVSRGEKGHGSDIIWESGRIVFP